MVFKGGTSLSKAYGLIHRFSEDIDVVTAVEFYLSRGIVDPETTKSKSQLEKAMDSLDSVCAQYIDQDLKAALQEQFAERLGVRSGWELSVDPDDRYLHTLLFQYPTSAPEIEHSYIRGRVKIELGWRSATAPSEVREFRSYVAEQFPDVMRDANVRCTVLSAARTFWEKVTALHAESYRDEVPHFFSRHYSDVAAMLQVDIGKAASRDLAMLEEVRKFKARYYPSARARYDLAVPGTLTIVPSESKALALATDYRNMRMMFFSEPPEFGEVMERLYGLQEQINDVSGGGNPNSPTVPAAEASSTGVGGRVVY